MANVAVSTEALLEEVHTLNQMRAQPQTDRSAVRQHAWRAMQHLHRIIDATTSPARRAELSLRMQVLMAAAA